MGIRLLRRLLYPAEYLPCHVVLVVLVLVVAILGNYICRKTENNNDGRGGI